MIGQRIRWLMLGLVIVSAVFAILPVDRVISTARPQPAPALVHHHLRKGFLVAQADGNVNVELEPRLAWPEGDNDPFRTVHFASPVPTPVVAPVVQPPVETPSVPQFPYHFAGRMIDIDGNRLTFFIRNGNLIPVQEGALLDGEYHVDLVSETQVQVTYLPLHEKTTVVLPSAAQ